MRKPRKKNCRPAPLSTGCQAASIGGNLGQFSERALWRVAVDAGGSIYAINRSKRRKCRTLNGQICRVQKFNAAATSAEEFAPAQLRFASNQN